MAHGCPCIICTYWHYLWNIELLTYLWYCQKIAQGQALLNQDMANYTNLASNFGVFVEFTSITRCVSMGYLYIYNQICIKLVNFTLKTLKISAEFKKKKLKLNGILHQVWYLPSIRTTSTCSWLDAKLKASWKSSVHLK